MSNPNIGKVTDPDQIGNRLVKFLSKQILKGQGIIGWFERPGRLDRGHFGEIHFFHQLVHLTFADGYAKITRKTKPDFAAIKALTGFGVVFQNLLPDVLILLLPGRGLPVYIPVIGTAVNIERPAKGWRYGAARKAPGQLLIVV